MSDAASGTASDPLRDADTLLGAVATRPLEEHVGVYDEVHRLLQDTLAALDAD